MADDTIIRKASQLKPPWLIGRKGRDVTCPACEAMAMQFVPLAARTRTREGQDGFFAELEERQGRKLSEERRVAFVDAVRIQCVLHEGARDWEAFCEALDATGYDLGDVIQVREKEPPTMNKHTPASAKAAADSAGPREPSREHKRQILAKLADLYVSDEVGYSADWSDEKLAASLSVPVAWVRELREEFHGENAGNESGSRHERERKRILNELRTDIHRLEQRLVANLADAERELSSIRARLTRVEGMAQ